MKMIKAGKARVNLIKLIDAVVMYHEPVRIVGKNNTAVLVSRNDWSAIQETMFLLSIPGMRKSIIKGIKTPVAKCLKKLKW